MQEMEWWHKLEAWGKAHPVGLGVAIFIFGAIIIYFLIPKKQASGTSGPSDAYYNAVAQMAQSGNQLQAAQLGYQAQSAQLQDQLTLANNQIAGQETLATIDSQTQLGLANISATAQSAHDKTVQESTDLASTLTAQVQTAGINAQTTIANINANAATQQTQIAAGEQLGIANYAAQTQEAGYAAQLDAFKTLTGAQLQAAAYNAQTQQDIIAGQVQVAGWQAQTTQQQNAAQLAAAQTIAQTQQTHDVIAGYTQDVQTLANAQVAAAAIGRG